MKKFAVLALALCAMFTLTACGESNAPANNAPVNQTVNQAAVNGTVDTTVNDSTTVNEAPVNGTVGTTVNDSTTVNEAPVAEGEVAEGEVVDGISGTEVPTETEVAPAQ